MTSVDSGQIFLTLSWIAFPENTMATTTLMLPPPPGDPSGGGEKWVLSEVFIIALPRVALKRSLSSATRLSASTMPQVILTTPCCCSARGRNPAPSSSPPSRPPPPLEYKSPPVRVRGGPEECKVSKETEYKAKETYSYSHTRGHELKFARGAAQHLLVFLLFHIA